MPFFFRHQKNAKNAQSLSAAWDTMNRTVRFVHPERVCGTRGASRMPFSHLRGGLKPPHCSGGFIPPVRFSSAGASCASRKELQRPRRHRGTERYSSSLASLRPLR